MARYRTSYDAQTDTVDILRLTHNRFGDAMYRRYRTLTGAALEVAATNPLRLGSIDCEKLGAGLRSIHLVHCRSMPNAGKAVRPRYFVSFQAATDQILEMVHVPHDSVDLDQHLSQR